MKEWLTCKVSKGSNFNKVIVSPKVLNTSFEVFTDNVDISSGLLKILSSKRIDNTSMSVSIPFLEGNKSSILKLKVDRKDVVRI